MIGGSLGGQQALEWALTFPDRVQRSIILAATPRLSVQGLAFNAVGRQAIMCDPNFRGGDYYGQRPPEQGLAVARMMACSFVPFFNSEGIEFTLEFLQQAAVTVPCAEFKFVPDDDVVDFVRKIGG